MHSTRKLLWIIIFMTLLLDLLAENLTASSQSTVNSSKSNSTLSKNSYDWHYVLQTAAVVIPILVVIFQICYHRKMATENTRDRIYVWCFWHIPRYVISRMHRNLQRRFARNREAHTNENVVHMQQAAETEV